MTQWHGGKGSTQRPKSIADEEYAQRWDAIFGKDQPENKEQPTPKITMCEDSECPLKNKCYRYVALPSSFQSYFVGSPKSMDGCRYFWPVEQENYTTFNPKEQDNDS